MKVIKYAGKQFLPVFLLAMFIVPLHAQDELTHYLKAHLYPFSLEEGFDKRTSDTLQEKLAGYKLLLQGEGGSHDLKFYSRLEPVWLSLLSTRFGVTHFFGEAGNSNALLYNRYLQTGDTSWIFVKDKTWWKPVYTYNATLPPAKKLTFFGIDFESKRSYVRALRSILPKPVSPPQITAAIDLIKNAIDTLEDCGYITGINEKLKKELASNRQSFIDFFGDQYDSFEQIILNRGSCGDSARNRNPDMTANFLSFDRKWNARMYYGQLGMAHTILTNRNAASMINNSAQFKDKVCVVNTYCYNCTTPREKVSNWPLQKIEQDILDHFLPLCSADFTLFDLSGDNPVIKKYKGYGQFLIIAKNQQ
jgi:hypothetical protein